MMTSLERVLKAARHEIPDRVPVMPLTQYLTSVDLGVAFRDYVLDGKMMAKAIMRYQRLFGVDAVLVGSDVYYLAEGFGAEIAVREDNVPVLVKSAISDLSEVETLRIPDPYRHGRMPVVLDCIEILRKELPDVAIVAIGGQATWSCALHIAGMSNFLVETALADKEMDEARPDLVHLLLEKTTQAYIEWQKAQIEAGCHVARLSDSAASINLCSPSLYRKFIHPYHSRIVKELKAFRPDVPIGKHTCGDNMAVLDLWKEEGVDWAEIDYQMDIGVVKERIGDRVCLCGNIDPVRVMLQGTPEDVMQACKIAIQKAAYGGGFILATGCQVPFDTPKENLLAMVESAREYGKY